MRTLSRWTKVLLVALGLSSGHAVLAPGRALAHCDGLDGPVVTAAKRALEKNAVQEALIWVGKEDEPAIREAFAQAFAVRRMGPRARELADRYFFETLVRLHRAGEGAPYTGLKPAGRDLGPAIPAADRALESGDVEPLVRLLVGAAERGLRERYAEARTAHDYLAGNVEAGREYIRRYVPFIHYVERLYLSATTPVVGHEPESGAAAEH